MNKEKVKKELLNIKESRELIRNYLAIKGVENQKVYDVLDYICGMAINEVIERNNVPPNKSLDN
jgi:hypothetical protein